MKKLTKEEFDQRVEAIARARKIFIPHLTKNITTAFDIYRELLAEQDYKAKLTKERANGYNVLSDKQRPVCPDCNRELAFRIICTPKGPQNINGYQTYWTCEDDDCCYEEFSKNPLDYWVNTLPIKE